MSLHIRWVLAALVAATSLSAQRSGNWASGFGQPALCDAFGSIIETRTVGIPSGEKILRGSGHFLAGFDLGRLNLSIFDRSTVRKVPLTGLGIDFAMDRNRSVWVIQNGLNVVEAYDYAAQRKRSLRLTGQPTALCLNSKNEVWVCADRNPGANVHWFDASSTNPVLNVMALPLSFGPASQILADNRQGSSPTLWLINSRHNDLLHLDSRGRVLTKITVGSAAQEANRSILLDNEGDLWIVTSRALYELDAATQRPRQHRLIRAADSFHFDPRGLLWRSRKSSQSLTRFEVHNPRPDLVSPQLLAAPGDSAGLYRAMIIDPFGDADGDLELNIDEIRIGTDPYDADSNSTIDLRVKRVVHTIGSTLVLNLLGANHPNLLLTAIGGASTEILLPGLKGTLRFSPSAIVPVTIAVPFGGNFQVQIPNNQALVGLKLSFQALSTKSLQLSNHASIVVGSESKSVVVETFANSARLDRDRSGGSWANGEATPGNFGGIGSLGSFDHTLGNQVSPGVFVWNTDQMIIPPSHTLFGNAVTVTNGRFDFTEFKVPGGVTVRFEGSRAAVIHVRGRVEIQGRVTVNGCDVQAGFNGAASGIVSYTPNPGQDATPGGAGGGIGGRGGAGHLGISARLEFSGQHGGDLVAPGVSGYSGQVATTGGRGSGMFPSKGQLPSLTFNYGGIAYASQTCAGGGGGGYLQPGGIGTVVKTFSNVATDMGPNTAGGRSVPFIPLPGSAIALDHFLLGGSGGGGTGSHPIGIQKTLLTSSRYPWHGGGAGAGGGGALAFLSGSDFVVGSLGSIEARGGSGDATLGGGALMSFGRYPPSPGGAGSGGTILIQTDGAQFTQQGTIDVSGGSAGVHKSRGPLSVGKAEMRSGAGAAGFVRIEKSNLTANQIGTVKGIGIGPVNWSQQVHAKPDWSGSQSLWYLTKLAYAPIYDYYELVVRINGTRVTFTDDPRRFNPANQPGHPVALFVQGAKFDLLGAQLNEPTSWRDRVNGLSSSLNADDANGFRFMLLFDPSVVQAFAVEEFRITHH